MTKHFAKSSFLIGIALIVLNETVTAQTIRDSSGQEITIRTTPDRKIDSVLAVHSPKKATIRSAILPGWGQAYNKKYWKIPIVYAALGTTAYIFIDNIKYYRDLRFAYRVSRDSNLTGLDDVLPELRPFVQSNPQYLAYQRDEFRRYIDYSVIAFVLLWGLNVIDATVDAHLKSFDVSPDLSFRFRAGYSDLAKTHGVSLVLTFK